MAMSSVRIALVGCGKIGQKHLQALVHQDTAELVATVDSELERAEAAAVAFDAEAYTSMEELVEHTELDAVIIATPSGLHRTLAEVALKQGLHVMVENPLALTYRDAFELVEIAIQRARVLTVTQSYRLLPPIELARVARQEGRLGRILEGSATLRWALPQAYYESAPWRGTREMDGGVIFNQAIPALDVLVQLMGPPEEVYAYAATTTHEMESEDTLVGVMRFAAGAMATINATTSVADSNLEESITVVGELGSLEIGPTVNQLRFWRVPDDIEEDVLREMAEEPARASWQNHADALQDFVEAISGGEAPALSASSVLPVIGVIEALLRSALEHRPVTFSDVTRW